MEDVCLVCAEPLVFTAYGPCGHKDACSKCILRLRTVLKDDRCVTCRHNSPMVYVTRAMGAYTLSLTQAQLAELPTLAHEQKVYYLESAQAYFDDKAHYEQMAALCTFSHPLLVDSAGRPVQCKSLQSLSSKIGTALGRRFCPLCLEGRKVFLAEQLLYTTKELEQHMRRGDLEGPLAEAGFHGHPECKFCNRRFYGENELYAHMHTQHEQCFLCRRIDPTQHVYYRDYEDLECHFGQEHFPCQQPACLEKKFVVFPSLQELRQHTVREHGEMLSKADKRAAMVVPLDFNFGQRGDARGGSRGGSRGASSSQATAEEAPPPPIDERLLRGAVTIGGGAGGIASRFASRRVASTGALAREDGAELAAAVQESLRLRDGGADGRGGSAPSVQQLSSEAEFPAMGPPTALAASASSGPAGGGRWAGAVGGAGGASSGAPQLRPEDFPSLPTLSKAAKKKQRQAQREIRDGVTLAHRLGARNAVTVLHAAVPGSNALGRAASAGSLREEDGWRLLSKNEQEAQLLEGLSASRTMQRPSTLTLPARSDGESASVSRADAFPVLPLPPPAAKGPPPESKKTAKGRAAHRALTAKIKAKVSPDEFESFRAESAAWVKGELTSNEYALAVVSLGLVDLLPDLVDTCPDAERARELQRSLANAKKQYRRAQGTWLPPEVAVVEGSSLAAPVPEPASDGGPRRQGAATPAAPSGEMFPALPPSTTSVAGPSSSNSRQAPGNNGARKTTAAGSKAKKKGGKQSLLELYSDLAAVPKHPVETAWGGVRPPTLRGQWKKQGAMSLAEKELVMQDAWGRR